MQKVKSQAAEKTRGVIMTVDLSFQVRLGVMLQIHVATRVMRKAKSGVFQMIRLE
jgi:hypothetical protein